MHRKVPVLESLFSKVLIKSILIRDFSKGAFLWNLQNFWEHFFTISRFNSCFQKSSKQNLVRLSAINTKISWKKYLLPQKSRNSHQRCSVKKVVLKNFAILVEKHFYWSLFSKVAGLKEIQTQVCSCECSEIFKNTYFEKHLWTGASENQQLNYSFTDGR